ncbi:MAG: hypothetical protein KAI66_20595, partial [Lentisphaeria bacterium]|nr:hypothetical protein [Lentisphaeria bacterium]
ATARLGGMRDDDTYYPIEEARAQLRALGLDETMTYSFINPEAAVNCTGFTDEQLIRPSNPLSSELGTMRPTLIPGILQSVAHNIAHNNDELAFFELGRVLANAPGFPEERDEVAIVMTGRAHPERFGSERESEIDFYDIKGMLECWLEARRVTAECATAEHPAFHKGACAALTVGGVQVAVFGEVCAELTTGLRLKHPLFLAVAQLDALRACETAPMTYQALPPFPAVVRDIALLASASLPCQAVIDTVADMKLPLIERVDLFDIYEDEKTLGAGRKSMAYSITYRDPRQTMTDKKVNKLHERVRSTIQSKLGVELR